MSKRPVTVTIIGWLLVVVGAVGVALLLWQVKPSQLFQNENVWIFLVRLLAVVCGIFMLRGSNWARWLSLAWIALHVGIAFFDSLRQGVGHSVILLLVAYFLFRPEASTYFRRDKTLRV
jgi:hypothetical protein